MRLIPVAGREAKRATKTKAWPRKQVQFQGKPELRANSVCSSYSTRSAITGLIAAARLAGRMLAISAQIANAPTDPANT
jgi:hypothetical protein